MRVMIINKLVKILSGEWLLDNRPNGGTVIFLRALWVAGLVYAASIAVKVAVSCPPDCWQALRSMNQAAKSNFLPFAAGTFAFAYTALYARFASQWSYLANLYNQIMETKVQLGICPPVRENKTKHAFIASAESPSFDPKNSLIPSDANRVESLQTWQVGFIEDAEELHLATKPMFASVIQSMFRCPGIRERFSSDVAGGEPRLRLLEARVRLACEEAARRH
jgi:hypothetical protein